MTATITLQNATISGTFSGTITYDEQPPPSGGGGYDLSKPPFTAASLWNQPVKSNPRFTNIPWEAPTGWNYWCTWEDTGVPVFQSSFDGRRWLDDGNGDIEVMLVVPAVRERPSVDDKGTASVALDELLFDFQARPFAPYELPVA